MYPAAAVCAQASKLIAAFTVAAAAGLPWTAAAASGTQAAALQPDLTQMSLDQLMNIEITSVSKRPERLSDAAAAVFVLTGEEIRRSGVRSIPEALRLVPGLEVARNNVQTYSISARGFNSTFADKLQVLLDGRSVYTPLFSGVFWDVLDTYLPDIDRIEVIRGPGAALWGANAVNGVINIVTKSARDILGGEVGIAAGNEEVLSGAARFGHKLGDLGAVRFYAKGFDRDNAELGDGSKAPDGSRIRQGGFRSDLGFGGGRALTVSGDAYGGQERGPDNGIAMGDTRVNGGNLLARWECCEAQQGRWSVQGYFDGTKRNIPGIFRETRETYDLSAEQHWRLGARHELVYGIGYRNSHDNTGGPPRAVLFDPKSRTLETPSAFVQDQISLLGGDGTLTVGTKYEHNDFTGSEVQPGVRFGYRVTDDTFTWAAISRAVRTPNRLNSDLAIFCPPPNGIPGICGPGTTARVGNPGLDAEKLIAYEWGLRLHPASRVSVDLATYYNHYDKLLSTERKPPINASFDNKFKGRGFGAELSAIWQPLDRLNVRAWYSFLHLDADPKHGSTDTGTEAKLEGSDPRNQLGLRVGYEPAPRWTVDSTVRYVDKLRFNGVPDYAELDLRVGWRLLPNLDLGLVGENLLHDHHPEFVGDPDDRSALEKSADPRSELERSVFAELRWAWR